MMEPVIRVNGDRASAMHGRVRLDLLKTLWISVMLLGTILAVFNISLSAIILFLCLTYFTLLFGHSIGMHRMMIHRTFKSSRWVQRVLIFIGVLVGMGGPFSMIRIHDMRDWAQRQPECHDFFSHVRGYWRDISWQLFYRFDLAAAPELTIEPSLANDVYVQFFEAYWRYIQIGFAGILFIIGGLPWVLWGVCARVLISIWGHWTITYICHNPGPGKWDVTGAGVQAANLPLAGFISHGECWHNNHHAFPESAQIGLDEGQMDIGFWVISQMEKSGLVYDVGRPRCLSDREDLVPRPSL